MIDFEFYAPPGERPRPICLSAADLISGQRKRVWIWDAPPVHTPFPLDQQDLVVAYFATAEIGCFEALGWPNPPNLIDLYAEHRVATNGLMIEDLDARKMGLLAALKYYGVSHQVDQQKKVAMRALAMRGGPFSCEEMVALMDYCDTDVNALLSLWPLMSGQLDEPRALFRGQFICAIAHMEHLGVPVDTERHKLLAKQWNRVRWGVGFTAGALHEGVYQETRFREDRFKRYLSKRSVPWPRLASGRLKLDDETWSSMARFYPLISALHNARKVLRINSLLEMGDNGVESFKFRIGKDGRNRAILSPFASKTGRNQPSTSKFVFSSAKWLRGGLVRPEPGVALAYLDWKSAEFGIAAALSEDPAMVSAYKSGDPYFYFAKLAGRVPPGGNPTYYGKVRNQFKIVTLAVGYGMTAPSLGELLGIQSPYAQELLNLHRRTFPKFWAWSDDVSATANGQQYLRTQLGWQLRLSPWSNGDRSLRNFPVQATGSELMQVATVLARQRGISVLASLHDAFLIQAQDDHIVSAIDSMREAMNDASKLLLGGLELKVDLHGPIYYPDRFEVTQTWRDVMQHLGIDP